MIYELAESGLFNILGSGLTALQCANKADLYEAFNYLAHQKGKHRVQNPNKLGL